MVLLRRHLPLMPQEDIGYELGLIVPRRYKKILRRARTGKMPPSGWGTRESKYPLNNFFRKHKIPLKKEFFKPAQLHDPKKWLEGEIKKGNDILACFNYGKLYGTKGQGHLSVVDSVSGNNVVLIDPSRKEVPKYRSVILKKLLGAMEIHPTGGFHLITPRKR